MSQGAGKDLVMADPSRSDLTNWIYPSNGAPANLIQQANTTQCMELVNSTDTIIEAACNSNNAYQLWKNVYDSSTGRTLFLNEGVPYDPSYGYSYLTAYGTYYGAYLGVQFLQFAGDGMWGTS